MDILILALISIVCIILEYGDEIIERFAEAD